MPNNSNGSRKLEFYRNIGRSIAQTNSLKNSAMMIFFTISLKERNNIIRSHTQTEYRDFQWQKSKLQLTHATGSKKVCGCKSCRETGELRELYKVAETNHHYVARVVNRYCLIAVRHATSYVTIVLRMSRWSYGIEQTRTVIISRLLLNRKLIVIMWCLIGTFSP